MVERNDVQENMLKDKLMEKEAVSRNFFLAYLLRKVYESNFHFFQRIFELEKKCEELGLRNVELEKNDVRITTKNEVCRIFNHSIF